MRQRPFARASSAEEQPVPLARRSDAIPDQLPAGRFLLRASRGVREMMRTYDGEDATDAPGMLRRWCEKPARLAPKPYSSLIPAG
jgi:hypothetical protein